MWGSAYFLSRLQNYCPTSTPARYKARQFLKTCAVPLIKYKRIDSCAKPGSKKWCPACLEGNKKEIWTISLLTARSSAAGTKRAEWHWWMSLRFRCRNIQVENYLVRPRSWPAVGFLCAAPPLGQITKACWNLRASPGPISRTERDRHRFLVTMIYEGPHLSGGKTLLWVPFLSLTRVGGRVNRDLQEL